MVGRDPPSLKVEVLGRGKFMELFDTISKRLLKPANGIKDNGMSLVIHGLTMANNFSLTEYYLVVLLITL